MLSLLGGAGYFIWDKSNELSMSRIIGLSVIILGAWAILYGLILKKEKKPLLQIGGLKWDEFNLGHILILGQTRRGKTVSALSNLITQFTETYTNWGGMILGVKGTEHVYIEEHFKHIGRLDDVRVLQVRPEDEPENWEPLMRINLTGDRRLPWTAYATMLVDAGKALSGESGGSSFWADTAEQVFANTFELLDRLDLPTTIPELYYTITQQDVLSERTTQLATMDDLDEVGERAVRYLDKTFLSAESKDQLEGTLGTLNQYMGFFMEPDISKVFCSDNPNVNIMDMDYGKVIASAIPQRFVKARKYIHTMLKSLAYNHGMMRFDADAIKPGTIKDLNRILLIMDEAQDVITASDTGMGDHTVADRIGGAKVTLIFAMQSAHSPDPKIGKEKRENLVNHFSSRFYFQLGNEEEAMEVSKYLGQVKLKKISKGVSRSKNGRNISRNVNEELQYRIQPLVSLSLDNHQCIVTHPSKDFRVIELAPLEPDGTIPTWFKETKKSRRGLGRFSRYINKK